MILILDNFDSFTHNLTAIIKKAGHEYVLVRNHVHPKEVERQKIKGLLISPGPGWPATSGFLMDYLKEFEEHCPILGICLGHQAVGEYYGMELSKANVPMHGKLSVINWSQKLYDKMDLQSEVVRYHSLVLRGNSNTLKIMATTQEGEIMAVKHKKLPIWGIQYHPEAYLTRGGEELVFKWLGLCRRKY